MQHFLAAGTLTACLLSTTAAFAFAPQTEGVSQTQDLRPPVAALVGANKLALVGSKQNDTFLGSELLPTTATSFDAQGNDAHPVINYFQKKLNTPGMELLQTSNVADGVDATVSFIQTLNGVPIVGTFALAHVHQGHVRYARHVLVTPPRLVTTPGVDSEAAITDALADVYGFAQSAKLAEAPSLAVVFVNGAPTLVWKVRISAVQPNASWDEFVDAQGGGVVMRHKVSLDAVAGTVTAQAEATCEGETPTETLVPYVQWTPGHATNSQGAFTSTRTLNSAQVMLNGAFFNIDSADGRNYMWTPSLQQQPATNSVALNSMPLGQIDPYIYLNQARSFIVSRASTVSSLNNSRLWPWLQGQVQVNANLPSGYDGFSCNAFYDPSSLTLNFYVDYSPWGCNNSGRANKIVYHEYGHSIHHHLTANDGTFDPVLSEGVADYTMATITNNPNVTGLTGCNTMLSSPGVQRPARPTWRTCENQYNYCNSYSCNSFPGDEAHHAAPIMCGALWDMRKELIKEQGQDQGSLVADQIFLRFLSFVTDMSTAYAAAIAADEDPDGNPANGTAHSCAINQAFLGDNGGFAHFPDAQLQRVPCNP